LSPTERRLRVGWRLVLHGLFVLGLTLPLALFAAVAIVLMQLFIQDIQGLSTWIGSLASGAAFFLATFLARRVLDRRSFLSLGFGFDRHTLPDLIIGFLIPLPMIALAFGLESSMGWVRWESWAWQSLTAAQVVIGLAGGLAMFAVVGLTEETLSRGYHLQNLAEAIGLPRAWLLSSIIFAALHVFNPGFSLQAGIGLVLAGLFLATGWIRTGRLWLSIGLHLGWNFFEGTVFGFAVSGLDLFRLMRHRIDGPQWVTGGGFGPEAGAVVLPSLLLGSALVWLYTRQRRKPIHSDVPQPGETAS
jgi:uncharacterized protein